MKNSQEVRAQILNRIVGKAVIEESFRQKLLSEDAGKALLDFDRVEEITRGEFDAVVELVARSRSLKEFAQGVEDLIGKLGKERE